MNLWAFPIRVRSIDFDSKLQGVTKKAFAGAVWADLFMNIFETHMFQSVRLSLTVRLLTPRGVRKVRTGISCLCVPLFIAKLHFDPSMSALPIIGALKSQSMGLFTRQSGT